MGWINAGAGPCSRMIPVNSEDNADVASGTINLFLTFSAAKMTNVQGFAKGGKGWHIGLETNEHMNIIHISNHPNFGVPIAFGSVKLFTAGLHI